MQIHQIKPKTKTKKTMLVGRGGKRGKTAGRGTKGQNARAGRKKRPEMRDIIKRIPKLRGRGVNPLNTFRPRPVIVNIGDLEQAFNEGDVVSPITLLTKNLISNFKTGVKILAQGDITKKLVIEDCTLSVEAKSKIEKAGGSVK